ncbi:Bifunctional heparan sulfate N-deacetylase/N-sulfotransferase, partial [Ooceraea biroi]
LIHRDTRPEPAIRCSTLRGATRLPSAPDHRSEARLRIDPKVLVFVETLYSRLGREIAELLVYNRIKCLTYLRVPHFATSFMRTDLILKKKRFSPSHLKVGYQRKLSSEFLGLAIVHTIRQKV